MSACTNGIVLYTLINLNESRLVKSSYTCIHPERFNAIQTPSYLTGENTRTSLFPRNA